MSDESEFDGEHDEDTYGDRHFRVDPSGDRRVTIGPLSFVVTGAEAWSDKLTRLGVEIEKHPRRLHDDDASAFAEMERHLREMHDALSAHLAPVLRWSDGIPSTATLGPWSLSANGCDWSVSIITATERVFVAARRTERDVREFCSRRAAEAALRSLGVAFRVEGES